MKLYDCSILILFGVLAALALATVAVNQKFDLEDDNEFEELVEEIIADTVGLEIDLSPSSPE